MIKFNFRAYLAIIKTEARPQFKESYIVCPGEAYNFYEPVGILDVKELLNTGPLMAGSILRKLGLSANDALFAIPVSLPFCHIIKQVIINGIRV